MALVLLSWKAAAAELLHRHQETAAVAGEGGEGLGQGSCLHSRERNNVKMCLCSEKRPWKNSPWGCMWLSSPGVSRSGFLAGK